MDVRKKQIQELMEVSGSSLGKGEQVTLEGDKEHNLKSQEGVQLSPLSHHVGDCQGIIAVVEY